MPSLQCWVDHPAKPPGEIEKQSFTQTAGIGLFIFLCRPFNTKSELPCHPPPCSWRARLGGCSTSSVKVPHLPWWERSTGRTSLWDKRCHTMSRCMPFLARAGCDKCGRDVHNRPSSVMVSSPGIHHITLMLLSRTWMQTNSSNWTSGQHHSCDATAANPSHQRQQFRESVGQQHDTSLRRKEPFLAN